MPVALWSVDHSKLKRQKKNKNDPFYQYLLLTFTQYNIFLIFLLLCVTPTVTCWLLFFNVHGYEYLIFFPSYNISFGSINFFAVSVCCLLCD